MLVDIVLAISKQTNKATFSPQNTKELEEWIVLYSKDLTPAENYLLPVSTNVNITVYCLVNFFSFIRSI